jgi:hypothetical protein
MHRPRHGTSRLAALATLLAACPDPGQEPDPGQPACPEVIPGAGENAPYSADALGRIDLLELRINGLRPSVFVQFLKRQPRPPEELVAVEGACALYQHSTLYCDDEACSGKCFRDLCLPQPEIAGAGLVSIDGLVTDVEIQRWEGHYYGEPPPGDLFTPDATITACATGDVFPAFEIAGRGVADLADEFPIMELEDDRDYTLRWTPGDDGATGFQLVLAVGWHGLPYEQMILCEGPDSGELVVSQRLIRELRRANVDFLMSHMSRAARFRRSAVETAAGRVELFIAHAVPVSWRHGDQTNLAPPQPARKSAE